MSVDNLQCKLYTTALIFRGVHQLVFFAKVSIRKDLKQIHVR